MFAIPAPVKKERSVVYVDDDAAGSDNSDNLETTSVAVKSGVSNTHTHTHTHTTKYDAKKY